MRKISSPDGKYDVFFSLEKAKRGNDCPVYRVDYEKKTIIDKSCLGFETNLNNKSMMSNEANLSSCFIEKHFTTHDHASTWYPVYGEREAVIDAYHQMNISLYHEATGIRMELEFRAYNEGIAFRYILDREPHDNQRTFCIQDEVTQFQLMDDYTAWATYEAQGAYSEVKLSQIGSECERPLTIQVNDDLYMAILEAGLVDYARMKLRISYDKKYCLSSTLTSEVTRDLPLTTPWRVIMAAHSPGELVEHNDIVLNLNEPCAIKDTSWIKPGTVIREMTLTTEGGLAYIDFASKHGIAYILLDAGWYGNQYDEESDATYVSKDLNKCFDHRELDLQKVIDYGKDKNVGVWLYVNRRALENQLDEILPIYKAWGVKGIKFGFVNVGSQHWTSWLHEAVRKAADYEMMVDVHDEYRPTGYCRTYPNLLTQEGVRGDEEVQENSMTLTTAFTRMICGGADNTVCYFNNRVDTHNSHAYQLAKSVVLYSPLQCLYWYDMPRASLANIPSQSNEGIIDEVPELAFYDVLPTVWDESRYLQSKISDYAVVARRSKDNWFMGIMNAEKEDRHFTIPFDFLDSHCIYKATIYSDDPHVNTRTHVRIDDMTVDSNFIHKVHIAKKGGQSILLEKIHEL